MKTDVKKLTLMSALVAVAMVLSYIESLIPAFVAIPGVKIGLSNIATVFALYILGAPAAITVSAVRVCLSALLFGNFVSLIYSVFGAILALITMILLKRFAPFSEIGVSTVGAIMHNAGQVAVACIIMENAAISLYIVPLIISGTISGSVIGLTSGILCKKLDGKLKL